MVKIAWDGPKWGQEDLFPTNPDLVDILGNMDIDFDNSCFICWIHKFWLSRFPDFQTPPTAEEFSDPNLTPLPTHPGIKYVARALAAI